MTNILTIIPSVPIWFSHNYVVFDRKFYDGIKLYVEKWDGKINCIMRQSSMPLPDFGLVEKKIKALPFSLTILEPDERIKLTHITDSDVIYASGDSFDKFHLSKMCKKSNIKCLYTIEYILETRYQILEFERNINPFKKLRRKLFLWYGERKRIAAFRESDGIHANGVAAYNEYKKYNSNCLLYFDTRINKNIIINENELNERLKLLSDNKAIKLAFSGRLISMKGADHLITLAKILNKRNINFKLSIYGTGELEEEMAEKIKHNCLSKKVELKGAVDFYNVLIPEIKKNIDLYIIPHRQSDPSCTYLETLSCGIPIVGYKNKAFAGLLEKADIGWGVDIDDIDGLADVIENLYCCKQQIVEKSKNCIKFSRLHDFETTFHNRLQNIRDVLEQ